METVAAAVEFQDFLRLPLDLADALVQARGLGIGLTLAHQHLEQLDRSVRSALLANAGSRVAFRLDHDDASLIAKRSGGRLKPEDLSGLQAFEAYASLLAGDETTAYGSLRTRPLGPVLRQPAAVLRFNRERWGVPRAETESSLRKLVEGPTPKDQGGTIGGRRRPGSDK